MKGLLLIFCFFISYSVAAQTTCTTAGQNPSTAFPVCGTSTFTQSSVPLCGGQQVPAPTCTTYPLTDINPFWYKFTCFQSGTLGFQIKPHTASEDYDWELFDVTSHTNLNDVYSNVSMVVACNWSGESGTTGASNAGTNVYVCEGYGRPLWSKMPTLIQGHDYLLLVSHFTQTQSGYDLSFGGGTAVITDSTPPHLKYAEASCGGDIVRVKLNKKMKCSSIATDGSDFFVTPGNITITSAVGIGCSSGFDADSVELHLNSPLAPGTYTLNVKNGTDNNTILDYCDNSIPTSDQAGFTVYPIFPTPMDSMIAVQCKPQSLHLIFKKNMLCSSVAADGSDFVITGPYPVTISGAHGNCGGSSTTSKEIIIDLSQPLYNAGNFTLTLKTGNDGNTILDECTQETPAGSSLSFSVKDTVNADFTYQKNYGCLVDTINFFHSGANGVNSWQWNLDDNQTSTFQNPQGFYSAFNQKNVQLIVSNGFCSDTSSQTISLDNYLKASFTNFGDVCPKEATQFTTTSQGHIVSYSWSFGDGTSSLQQSPSHIYTAPYSTTSFTVSLTVTDSLDCQNTASKTIVVYSSCYLAMPNAFTPNNDGLNDFFHPLNAIKAENVSFRVYNRWGQLLFQSDNWKHGWDGTYNGKAQPSGVYVWFLSYVDRDTKQSRQMKGTVVLIR